MRDELLSNAFSSRILERFRCVEIPHSWTSFFPLMRFLISLPLSDLGSQISCGEFAEPGQSEGTMAQLSSGQEQAAESGAAAREGSAHWLHRRG